VCLIFGTTFVAIKVGINAGFPPLLFAGLRFTLAGLMALAIVLARRQPLPRSAKQYGEIALVGLAATTVSFAALFWSEQYLTAGMAAILTAAAPMLVLLISTGGRLSGWQALSIAGGIAGVGLVMAPSIGQGSTMALVAAGVLIASELGHAWGSVRAGAVMKAGIQPLPFSGLQMLFGGVGLLLASLLLEVRRAPAVSPEGWWALLYLAVAGSLVAWGLYYWLVAKTGPLFPSTWTYVSPVLATIAGAWFLAEEVTVLTFAGVALVLVSVALTDLKTVRRLLRPAEASGD
jgi:drug/metabolite transporter (DMT)-like permease